MLRTTPGTRSVNKIAFKRRFAHIYLLSRSNVSATRGIIRAHSNRNTVRLSVLSSSQNKSIGTAITPVCHTFTHSPVHLHDEARCDSKCNCVRCKNSCTATTFGELTKNSGNKRCEENCREKKTSKIHLVYTREAFYLRFIMLHTHMLTKV